MSGKNFKAFTSYFPDRASQLTTEVGIAVPTDKTGKRPTHKFGAIWDTGATTCIITTKLVRTLRLKPVSKGKMTGVHGTQDANIYFVDIFLPNMVCIPMVRVLECPELVGDAEMLIGMDIIGIGDLSVTHVDGKTTMSYRVPSIKTIDYVVEANKIAAQHATKLRKRVLNKRQKR